MLIVLYQSTPNFIPVGYSRKVMVSRETINTELFPFRAILLLDDMTSELEDLTWILFLNLISNVHT